MTCHDLLKLPFPSSGDMDSIRRFWIVDMNPWVLDIVKVGNLGLVGVCKKLRVSFGTLDAIQN